MQPNDTLPPIRKKQVLKDLIGETFGSVRVIARAENYTKNKSQEAQWRIECVKCHRESIVRGNQLRSGRVTGKRCVGCKPPAPEGAETLVIDAGFVRRWTPMICTAASQVFGGFFSPRFNQLKDDVLSDTFMALSKSRARVHPNALSTFVFRTAKTIAIDKLRKAIATPELHASGDSDAPGSYEFIIASLTDGVPEVAFDERSCLMAEAFSELSEEEQTFCKEYAAHTEGQPKSSQQRMWQLRKKLRERLQELIQHKESIPSQEVHVS